MSKEAGLQLKSKCSQESDDEVVLHRFHLHDLDDEHSEHNKCFGEDVAACLETVPTISSAETKSTGAGEQLNFLTNEDLSPPNTSPVKDLRKASAEILSMAYRERKMDNLRLLKIHHQEIANHTRSILLVFGEIELGLSSRLQSQKELATAVLEYFGAMYQALRDHYKTIQKNNVFEQSAKQKNNSSTVRGLTELTAVYADYHDCVKRLAKWLEQKLLAQLAQSLKQYCKNTAAGFKDNHKSYLRVKEKLQQCQRKFRACTDDISQNDQKSKQNDLFCLELELATLHQQLREKLVQLYRRIDANWQLLEAAESVLLQSVKEHITNFLQQYAKVYPSTPRSEELTTYWRELQLRSNDMFDWVWNAHSKDSSTVILTSKKDLDEFAALSQLRFRLPADLNRLLINRRFTVEVEQQKGKEWKEAQLCMTIDSNAVLLVNDELYSKFTLFQLDCQLNGNRIVFIKERSKRLFSDNGKATVRFRFSEEAEEFMCLCDTETSPRE